MLKFIGGCYGSGILNSIFRNYYDSVSYPDTKEMEDTARQNLLDDAVLDFEGEKKGFNGMDPINIKVPDHIKIRPSIRGPRHTISIPWLICISVRENRNTYKD